MNALLSPRPLRRYLAVALAVILLPLAGACVEDVGLVNRTNSDKIDKQLLGGVWIYAQTTVDAPYSTAMSFTGETNFGGSAKIVFDVQEDKLIAYPVVEAVDGTEDGYKFTKIRKYWDPDARDEFVEMYVAQPIAVWPIESHYDVIRKYNSYNGAQTNEVVENTTDRPWYERDFIRVAWHDQKIGQFFYELAGDQGTDSYFVGQDKQGQPDQMTLDLDGGYLDYVVRSQVAPRGQTRCSIFGLSPYDCAEAEVRVRHSFRKLDPERDYEPLRYHNNEHQDKFGYFLTERNAWDEDWGPSYEGKVSYANRWNLWEDNFTYEQPTDADGNPLDIPCTADWECDEAGGERCQKTNSWFEEGYCAKPVPRPFSQRTLRPVVYHLNADWHPDYMADAYASAEGWNEIFRDTVAWMLFFEERGELDVRACEVDADCAVQGLVADRNVPVTYDGLPCHGDAECSSGFCGSSGYCAETRTCGAGTPCAVGQACQGGVCVEDGQQVERKLDVTATRGSSVIYYGGGSLLTHDNFSNAMLSGLGNSNAYVRFVHAAPDAGDLGLTVNGANLPGGAFDTERDYDPADPATGPFVAAVPAGTGLEFTVTAGGAQVATKKADLVAKNSYTVVYNGEDVLVFGESFNNSRRGVRFIHAAANEGPMDAGLAGVRISQEMSYRDVTSYENIAGATQRATISRAGSRGDITCHMDEGVGRCVGWGSELTQEDLDRKRQIKQSLPDLFLICQNRYDEFEATDQANIQAAAQTQAGILEGEPDRDGGYYGDAWYTQKLEDGGYYNPCGDPELVPHPTEMKRIGDIRYSFFYWVNEAMRAGPLGYGPSIADPDTGQIISATANIYGGALHTYGQWAADLIDLVSGDLSMDDVVTGRWIREYLDNRVEPDEPETATVYGGLSNAEPIEATEPMNGDLDPEVGLAEDAASMHGRTDLTSKLAEAPLAGRAPVRMPEDYEFPEIMDYMRHPQKLKQDVEQRFPQIEQSYFHDRLQKVRGTWIEDLALNNEIMSAAPAVDPTGEMTQDELMRELSPASWASKYAMREEEKRREWFSKRNMYMAEFVDDALFGLAQELKNEGYTDEQLRLEVSRRILRGVLEHEVGHTIGLRHNFSGSTDVFNFHDEYYSIRESGPMLCQADGWCDQVAGEACVFQQCGGDDDCVSGLCVGGECVAPASQENTDLVPTGLCGKPVADTTCASDDQCGEGQLCDPNSSRCHDVKEQMLPRSWITDNEKKNKRTEYQYTSIMDYGGRFNSDFHGMGKYDAAAIRFGYGQLVDTYRDTSKLEQRVEEAARNTGSPRSEVSFYMNTEFWPTRGTGFYHPFNYLTNYIGVQENLDRVPRPYEQVKFQKEMVVNDRREYLDLAYVEVPYAMCSDEYRGNMGCYYFDMGIDAGEMARHAWDQLEQYYIFDAFKRERLYYGQYGSAFSYFGRIMDRYLRVLGDVGMYYGFYEELLFRYSWYESWKDSPLGGQTYERSARNAFGWLQDIVSSPAPGSYVYDDLDDSYVNVALEPGVNGSELDIPLGIGRYPYTRFGYELGYTYAEHPLWFGSFWEKIAALLTLTDSTANFVDTAVGEQLDIGVGTSVGYNTVFADQMNSFLGGIIADEQPLYAGRVIQDKYTRPSVAMKQSLGETVEPALNNFTLKLYAALFGLAYLPAGFDPQFIDNTAVFLEDEASYYEHANEPGITEHRFEDPIGGKVYVAYGSNYGEFGSTRISAGAALVDEARSLADAWEEATGEERLALERRMSDVREVLDVLRGLNQIYGASTLGF
ncbi:MAG: zinc-dependent metalloprotease [Myxococcota bacterium]